MGVKISGTVGIVIEVRKRNKSTRKVECDSRSLDLEGSRLGWQIIKIKDSIRRTKGLEVESVSASKLTWEGAISEERLVR